MIAPVAAPYAALAPTGVSHDVRAQTINANPAVAKTIPLFTMQIRRPFKPPQSPDVAGISRADYPLKSILGIYEYFLRAYVQDQAAVGNFRAVVLLIRRVRAGYDS